jgi:hypothetical protein
MTIFIFNDYEIFFADNEFRDNGHKVIYEFLLLENRLDIQIKYLLQAIE